MQLIYRLDKIPFTTSIAYFFIIAKCLFLFYFRLQIPFWSWNLLNIFFLFVYGPYPNAFRFYYWGCSWDHFWQGLGKPFEMLGMKSASASSNAITLPTHCNILQTCFGFNFFFIMELQQDTQNSHPSLITNF